MANNSNAERFTSCLLVNSIVQNCFLGAYWLGVRSMRDLRDVRYGIYLRTGVNELVTLLNASDLPCELLL